MKKKVLLAVVLAIVFMVGTLGFAQAENFIWASDYRLITEAYPDNGDFYFYLPGNTIDSNSSCPNRFVIRNTVYDYKDKVASLLSSLKNERRVKVLFDDDDTGCATNVGMLRIIWTAPPRIIK